jgi:hypothetical protein
MSRNVCQEEREAKTLMNGTWHGRKAKGWVGCQLLGMDIRSIQMGGTAQPASQVFLKPSGGPPDAQIYVYLGCETCGAQQCFRIPELIALTNLEPDAATW